jgi:glycosyltransferase involved in cell wall biosynthesis
VIHNGVESAPATAQPGACPARMIVVANLIDYKGHTDVLHALAILERPPATVLVGHGPRRPYLMELSRSLGLTGVVTFAGAVPDARTLLGRYQIAVLASHAEGLPNAVLEAMAAGLPVVATAVGGVPELVVDEYNGLLVPPGVPTELAKAIDRLVSDPELRCRLGAAARATADRFTVSACVRQHEALYREQR